MDRVPATFLTESLLPLARELIL